MGNKKTKLFIDIDDTIYNSTKVLIDVLNNKNDTLVTYQDVRNKGFKNAFPNVSEEEINRVFSSPSFYSFVNEDKLSTFVSMSSIFRLQERCKYRINFVTLGTISNLENKKDWLDVECEEWGIEYDEYYGDTNSNSDKTFVDMSGGIFIDDNINCLRNSNASIKILLKNYFNADWNNVSPNDEVYVANSWTDIVDILEFFYKNKEMI